MSILSISNCIFKNNSADYGGAINSIHSNLTVTDSIFIENSTNETRGGNGGGIYFGGDITPSYITGCQFRRNRAAGGGSGAAIYCDINPVVITGCVFDGNYTGNDGGGGGIYLSKSTPSLLKDLIITNNKSKRGGGICCFETSMELNNCEIRGNIVDSRNPEAYGGGIFFWGRSNPVVRNCKISENGLINSLHSFGGGICCSQYSQPEIINCEVTNNRSLWGSGIACNSSQTSIKGCLITGNTAIDHPEQSSAGGGIYSGGSKPVEISDSIISDNSADFGSGIHCFDGSNAKIKNCLISNNEAFKSGGALYSDGSSPTLINCTLIDNSATRFNGVAAENGGTASISSSILWEYGGNTFGGSGELDIICSDVREGFFGENIFSIDPLFVSGPWGDYYLSHFDAGQSEDSSCIDAGANTAERFDLDFMTTRTDGVFDTGVVDLGYHYPPNVLFDLYISPLKEAYGSHDTIEVNLDIRTGNKFNHVDIYFILNTPEGEVFSGMAWGEGLCPMISDFKLGEYLEVVGVEVLKFRLPSETLPISGYGTYTFAIAGTDAGTFDIVSNLALTSFCYLE